MSRINIHKKKHIFSSGIMGMLIVTMLLLLTPLIAGCNIISSLGNNASSDTSVNLDELLLPESDSVTGNGTGYKTHTVSRSDIISTIQYASETDIPYVYDILLPYSEGRLTYKEEFLRASSTNLGDYDYLEKGEEIASFTIHCNQDDVTAAQVELDRAKAFYQENLAIKKEELNSIKKLVSSTSSVNKKVQYEFEYQEKLNAYNEYVAEQDAIIASLTEKYEFLMEGTRDVSICAPENGIVILGPLKEGQIVEYGDKIATFYKIDDVKLKITNSIFAYSNSAPVFNYGDKITIDINYGREHNTFPGTVISAPNALYGSNISHVIVEFDDFDSAVEVLNPASFLNRINIRGVYKIAEDALVIPPEAMEILDDNTGTVTMYNDGAPYSVNVTYSYKDSHYVWITSGLKEGDIIVIN
ncbi:MAG: hypothetical protein IJW18_06745 [Lachnospiraceae bacterium]|nr:hypothetical protein [Lachnospiraceae bacterium]